MKGEEERGGQRDGRSAEGEERGRKRDKMSSMKCEGKERTSKYVLI